MARILPPLPAPGTAEAYEWGCTCPKQVQDSPPWTVNGDCPLHGYGAKAEERTLAD